MSIYSIDQLYARLSGYDREELLIVMQQVLRMKLTDKAYTDMARIIMREKNQTGTAQKYVKLSHKRAVPLYEVVKLKDSPLLAYLETFIEVALTPGAILQTRDIMMITASRHGGASFIKADGINFEDKKKMGYLLSMAGFERKSHYSKEAGMPLKAWRLIAGQARMTISERAQHVLSIIRQSETEAFIMHEDKKKDTIKTRLEKSIPQHLSELI